MPKLASVSVYMTPERKERLQARAEGNHRSVAAEIINMIETLERIEEGQSKAVPGPKGKAA